VEAVSRVVEPAEPGCAYVAADGLLSLYGGPSTRKGTPVRYVLNPHIVDKLNAFDINFAGL